MARFYCIACKTTTKMIRREHKLKFKVSEVSFVCCSVCGCLNKLVSSADETKHKRGFN